MCLLRRLALVLLFACGSAAVLGAEVPGKDWSTVAPQDAGWSERDLAEASSYAGEIGSSALLVVQHGKIVAARGDVVRRIELHSIRKSLLNALIGIAVEARQIDPSATLAELGIDDNPPSLTAEEKGARVIDLLRARSGVYHPALYETPAMAAHRPPRGSHPPGTFWYYNNWDFNALGTIYERAAHASIFAAFEQLIALPIGMQDYRPSDGRYVTGAASLLPAYPFHMSARDLARFALLFLDGGRWGERQLVPAEWVRQSTMPYSASDFGPGYGMLWWTGPLGLSHGNVMPLPPGSYFALGYKGQYAFVLPALDMVVVNLVDSDAGKDEVTMAQMARLLWLVLHAAGSRDIPVSPP
ncbi:MAG TPA: serine hydrolase [Alphaproteobacteria bacterium]|nr:serine hydrolase [Alphaproteobacteria bacterium]